MDWNEFTTLAIIHIFAIASPGPNVISVMANSVTSGRNAGVLTGLGVSLGNLFHIGIGIAGIGILARHYPTVTNSIALLGVTYLFHMGIHRIKSATRHLDKEMSNFDTLNHGIRKSKRYIWDGVIINVTNTKGGLFFVAIFSTVISPDQAFQMKVFYGAWMACVNFLFLSALAFFCTHTTIANILERRIELVNYISGIALISVAVMLAINIVGALLSIGV